MIKSFLFFIKDNLSFFQHDVLQSVLNFVGLLKSARSSAIVPSWLFRGFKIFSCEYFVGPNNFLEGISWVQNFFSWVFRGLQFFSRGFSVRQKFFLVGNSLIKDFFSWIFRWSMSFSHVYFVGPKFFRVGSKSSLVIYFGIFSCWQHEKKRQRNISETAYYFPDRFQQL